MQCNYILHLQVITGHIQNNCLGAYSSTAPTASVTDKLYMRVELAEWFGNSYITPIERWLYWSVMLPPSQLYVCIKSTPGYSEISTDMPSWARFRNLDLAPPFCMFFCLLILELSADILQHWSLQFYMWVHVLVHVPLETPFRWYIFGHQCAVYRLENVMVLRL